MDIQHLFAAVLIVLFTGAGVFAAACSQRLRDGMFLAMVAGSALPERMNVNFWSHVIYRGTSRGIEVSGLDILAVSVLVASVLMPREGESRFYWPAGLLGILLFSFYCFGSVVFSEPQVYGLFEVWKLGRGLVFFLATAFYVRSSRELKLMVLGLVCAVGLEALVSFRQWFFLHEPRAHGHLNHPNSLSMYLCLVSPLLVAGATATFPRWVRRGCLLALGLAAGAMVLTLSRTGVLAFTAVVVGAIVWCVPWRLSWKRLGVGFAGLALVGVLLTAAWQPLMARFGESTLTKEYLEEGQGRGIYLRWAALIVADHPWGVGLNNWSYWVSKVYGAREGVRYEDYDSSRSLVDSAEGRPGNYAAPAHNLGALLLGELGVAGLLLFMLLWLRWFQVGLGFLFRSSTDPMRLMGVGIFFGFCGVFLQSLTEWTYRHSPIFITFHMLAGALAGLHYYWKNQKAIVPATVYERPIRCIPVDFAPGMAGAEIKSS